jgi:DNA-directed RNA polymerase subunit RPC12/RpoP
MLTLITCPTCHHKFPVPESGAGQRRTCPNCDSVFVGEKQASENGRTNGSSRRGLLERAADEASAARPPMDRTMLAEVDAPIKYNCPRCKTALESPTSESGMKKPCPSCGGRLQVPPAPAPVSANPALNKTMLGVSDFGPQTVAPAPFAPTAFAPDLSQASAPIPTIAGPSPGQLFAEHGWKVGVGALLVVGVVLIALCFQGKSPADQEQEKLLQAQKLELERLKGDIETKTALLQQQQDAETKQHKVWQETKTKQEEKQRELDRERDLEMRRVATLNDEKFAAETKFRLDQKQRELEEQRKKADEQQAKAEQEMRDQIDQLRKQLEAAKVAATKTGNAKLKVK